VIDARQRQGWPTAEARSLSLSGLPVEASRDGMKSSEG
jgi:hypothetical protein